MMMMMSNVNGRRRKRDHQEEEDEAAFMKDYPAGYKFQPTDEELIKYYLYPKIKKLPLPPNTIKDVNIYSYNPWDLTETYGTIYFFTPRERKYSKGDLPNRAANGGYWKTTGNEIPIIDDDTDKVIGHKRVLVFELRKRSKAGFKMNKILRENQTGWKMHEYTLKDEKNKSPWTEAAVPNNNQLDEFVLCKMVNSRPRKSTKDRAVDAAAPPSIATTIPSAVVAAAVPENHHQMHHYPLNSAAAAEEMMPQNHHMCRTDVAAADHQYSLTSMVLEATASPEEMMPFNHNYYSYYSDDVNPSSSSAILPPVNHHYYGEMNQQQLQSTILPSVNHHYYGEMMNQQQLQSAMLPSVNQHYYGEMNQQQLQPEVLPSVNYHTDGQMNEQQLQPAVLPSVNHPTDGQMTQEQLQEESDWAMLVAAWNNDTDFFLKLRERREKQEQPTTTKKEKQITKRGCPNLSTDTQDRNPHSKKKPGPS